jgi:Calcineurin-like phosphoesterase
MAQGYDIIGDVHGYADALVALLLKMGYRKRNGVWSHTGRQAIFVGDLIDLGPKQVETVQLVKSMVEAGSALTVLGNHDLNAIAWYSPDPTSPGE